MLRLLKATPRTDAYADVFIARYERLLVWSLKLTDHDRQMAEDLVHDTFVQFMLSRPNLDTVQNLDAYLYCTQADQLLNSVFGEKFKDGC
ncbi:MAG TPA: sigma factor [Pyrinomonadaceae bacterium]|jgi:DNA-directed RNA polymerase specialized sigma24 family protein